MVTLPTILLCPSITSNFSGLGTKGCIAHISAVARRGHSYGDAILSTEYRTVSTRACNIRKFQNHKAYTRNINEAFVLKIHVQCVEIDSEEAEVICDKRIELLSAAGRNCEINIDVSKISLHLQHRRVQPHPLRSRQFES
jgi:hypothetical protein